MAVRVSGIPREADGSLALGTGAAVGSTLQNGCLYEAAGRIAVSVLGTPVRTRSGLPFDVVDRLVVAVDTAPAQRSGFGWLDANGRLVVTATGPFAKAASFDRDAAGRLRATIT